MPSEIYLVKVGMTMTEGSVEEWCIEDGACVVKGELLYRLETEKINMDVDADFEGIVKHLIAPDVVCEPGDVIGYIYAADEEIPEQLPIPEKKASDDSNVPRTTSAADDSKSVESGARKVASPAARRLAAEMHVNLADVDGSGPNGRIVEADVRTHKSAARIANQSIGSAPSSPSARRLARELDVDLGQVTGTGPHGRITEEDVRLARGKATTTASAKQTESSGDKLVPLGGMRRTIAKRMMQSLQTSAQLTMEMEAIMDDAVKLREQLIAEWQAHNIRPTYTDLVIRAVAKALTQHPLMNSEFTDNGILHRKEVHIGMAVALEEGLLVPVVRNADRLELRELIQETSRLASAAQSEELGLDDMSGGTFTVSAMGMFGVDSFTPILNMPQVGILGVNRLYDGVAWNGDTPVRRKMMRLSLTWDHRAVDGAPAAAFLRSVCDLLEAPHRLLI